MKTKQTIFASVVAALLFATVGKSFAAAQTYHGTLTGGEFFCDGELLDPPPYSVTGIWNLSIDPHTPAQVTLNVFYNGSHHLAFGYNALMLMSYSDGIYIFAGFGDSATATLDTNVSPATFSWHVELGVSCPDESPYNSLTFSGVGNRGGG